MPKRKWTWFNNWFFFFRAQSQVDAPLPRWEERTDLPIFSSKTFGIITQFHYLREIRSFLAIITWKSNGELTSCFFVFLRPWLDMFSPRVTQTSASNLSPTFPEESSPTWIMTSRFRRRGFVHKRLYLCRRGTSLAGHSLFFSPWSVFLLKTSPFHKSWIILLASIP